MQALFTSATFSLIIFLSSTPLLQSVEICPYFSCNKHRRDTIQFPFRVPRNQSFRCGFPGFDLSCKSNGETLLKLPSSSNSSSSSSSSDESPFVVLGIDYPNQLLWISDPNHCIPKRVMDMNLTGSPYQLGPDSMEYSFLNCSNLEDPNKQLPAEDTAVVSCMSGGNFTVVATADKAAEDQMVKELKCGLIKRVAAPLWWPDIGFGLYPDDMSDLLVQLSWDIPGCRDCVLRGGSCGFAGDSGLTVGCSISGGNSGLPKGVKYGLMLGAGIPGLVCMIGLTFYISGKVRARNNQHRQNGNNEASHAIFPQPMVITLGLDGPTIESYPKTVLGQSRRLPKPNDDATCPICLSEYEPNETLRIIPECNHYFHAHCIDEWLRMNATCPLCRNSPQKRSS